MLYIDPPVYRLFHGKRYLTAHLISDLSLFELHAFAKRLRLHPRQFHNKPFLPHYDLFGETIFQAMDMGAVLVPARMLVQILKTTYPV